MSDKNESKKSVLDRLSGDLVDDNCSESEDRKESIDDTGVENEERGGNNNNNSKGKISDIN